ncbi:MAG: FMN-binding protein [Clostridia bacterium]|jgi:major membrane immunogen (membrane-anchored lipoprotein)
MKKFSAVLIVLFMAFSVLSVSAQARDNGIYFAEQSAFSSSGWKYQAVLEVKGGKIVAANWNAVNRLGVADKKSHAAAGLYGMAKIAKQGEWDVQAARVEAELLKVQDPAKIAVKADGKTDAISGVSVTVKEFLDLAKEALAAGPVPKGSYSKDGWYYAKAASFDSSGYASTALITVVNGRIVSAVWNALHKNGGDSKYVRAIKGSYKMNAKQGEWNVQSDRVAAELVKLQDPSKFSINANKKTDAISGVSVTMKEFADVAMEALKAAR